mmetsp:Transcript_1339/g.4657  ORF Transcript_1339/g.4657 Transcript_1339/m.4657 type:complete len:365 (-) Transcript_1339:349-1443(-)
MLPREAPASDPEGLLPPPSDISASLSFPKPTSQTMAVLSTDPERRYFPSSFHLREKMGPLWPLSVLTRFPLASQTLACPSYDPVARYLPSELQSSVVTSRSRDLEAPPAALPWSAGAGLSPSLLAAGPPAVTWLRQMGSPPPATSQILAVESPDPLARSEFFGLHWMMKTSEVWPRRLRTSSSAISFSFSSAAEPSFPGSVLTASAPASPASVSMGEGPEEDFFFSSRSLEACAVLDFLDFGGLSPWRSPPPSPRSRSRCLWDLSRCSFFFCIVLLSSPTSLVSKSSGCRSVKSLGVFSPLSCLPSAFKFASSSTYWRPFCMNDTSAPGGTSFPLISARCTMDSKPKVNAACWNPLSCRYRKTK